MPNKEAAAIFESGTAVEVNHKSAWLPARYLGVDSKRPHLHVVVLGGEVQLATDGRRIRPSQFQESPAELPSFGLVGAESAQRKKLLDDIIRRAEMLRYCEVSDPHDVAEGIECLLAGVYHLGDTFGLRASEKWYADRAAGGSTRAEVERDTAELAREDL